MWPEIIALSASNADLKTRIELMKDKNVVHVILQTEQIAPKGKARSKQIILILPLRICESVHA